mgnify:CR=1 FL=1
MYINRKELKAAAKAQIKGNVGTFFGLSIVLGLILSVSAITFVGPFVLLGPLALGLSMFAIEVVRTNKGNFGTGFNGFKQFGAAFVAALLMTLFTSLWALLFVFPAYIAIFRYSMTFFIIADEPELSGAAAIKKSKEMMKGHKWELFVLLFSFFWWYILGIITFGLAYIYIIPYIEATVVNFYEKIKDEKHLDSITE